jgi:acyl-CoA thioesterase
MSFADLASDTAVRALGEGRYAVMLPDHWDFLLPSGGAVMTCALRAAEAELAEPELRLASATTIYATPVHPGELALQVFLLRKGHGAAQLRVTVRHQQAMEPGPQLELVATFCRDRKGPDVIGVVAPALPRPTHARPVDDDAPNNPHTRFRIFRQLECRVAEGERVWLPEFAAGPARYARWMRYRVPQCDTQGRLDRLALPPLIDMMPAALHRAIGPGAYRFHAPSLDLTVYTVDDTTREWLLVVTTCRRARSGWAIGDAEVWDDEERLIAYGSQAMYIQTVAGDPPVVDASRRR